ncbi:MAG: PD-(D/E)XK nuclease family protein [Gemmatimonadota bacterium]|nr:PD-(D/E)XK nuclease family protein [Gemmatimonadota bacterium]
MRAEEAAFPPPAHTPHRPDTFEDRHRCPRRPSRHGPRCRATVSEYDPGRAPTLARRSATRRCPIDTAALPRFSWSHSRDRTFARCARRYYLRYYAGAGGWREDADPATRAAYCLRHLITLELALGIELHERAREMAGAVRARRPVPSAETLRARTRSAMNRLYARHDVAAFLTDPKRSPVRMEVFYERGTDPDRLARLREKMELCLEALCGCALWSELAEIRPEDVLLVDRLSAFALDGVTVYAAPDLVYRTGEGHVIVEWKTGPDPGVREQTALYGLFVREGLGASDAEGRFQVRLFRLDLATEERWEIGASDLAGAEARVRDGAATMRRLLRDAEANAPKPIESFPLTPHRGQCSLCPFWAICEDEIRTSAPAGLSGSIAPSAGQALPTDTAPERTA